MTTWVLQHTGLALLVGALNNNHAETLQTYRQAHNEAMERSDAKHLEAMERSDKRHREAMETSKDIRSELVNVAKVQETQGKAITSAVGMLTDQVWLL